MLTSIDGTECENHESLYKGTIILGEISVDHESLNRGFLPVWTNFRGSPVTRSDQ